MGGPANFINHFGLVPYEYNQIFPPVSKGKDIPPPVNSITSTEPINTLAKEKTKAKDAIVEPKDATDKPKDETVKPKAKETIDKAKETKDKPKTKATTIKAKTTKEETEKRCTSPESIPPNPSINPLN